MRGKLSLLAGVCASAIAFPAFAQSANDDIDTTEIIVTAQRSNQRLQDVPIAVSAFNTEALEKQQIKNTSDLQLSLPNVTFTKTNFTSASFTIRGIGDLCVGVTCDQATAIHMNDAPLFGTRLFEGEFYDLAQIEVLRGPQGTLFGRNATSGVVNFRTARPDLTGMAANVEAEYGNYNSVKAKGMVNVPLGEVAGVRLAGFYLNRDGYTKNLFDNSKIDDRDMYGLRGSIRIEPAAGTTIDLMAQYFHEKDSRMRIQKQMCQRDPTGVLGCLAAERRFEMTNANSTAGATLNSRQLMGLVLIPDAAHLWLTDLNASGTDGYAGVTNPADMRTVNTAFKPSYYTQEWIVQGSVEQDLGSGLTFKLSGNYQNVELESQQDYNNAIQTRSSIQAGLNGLAALAAAPGYSAYFGPIASRLMPNGPAGVICTSLPTENLSGQYGASGQSICSNSPLQFDRSNSYHSNWTLEGIVSSDWDGMFNFLLGGIYGKVHNTENSYYVNAFGLDYAVGVHGAWNALAANTAAAASAPLPYPMTSGQSYYYASPYFHSNTDDMRLTTYGLFGEAYIKLNDRLKLTAGLRYNDDTKSIKARTTLLSYIAPTGVADATTSRYIFAPAILAPNGFDADKGTTGSQLWQERNNQKFSAVTGRVVLDFQVTPDNLLYASYSRGYKSGGINPPLSVGSNIPEQFDSEKVDAFEIGSKNTFGNVQLNLTGFYYDYGNLQLSRIINRTSINDNLDARVYGLEAEAILRPTPELTLNMNASYLHTEVTASKNPMADSRDFGGGRADAVIIKDILDALNCAIGSNTGSAAAVNGFVNAVNAAAGLNPAQSFGAGSGIASTGAYGFCSTLKDLIANPTTALRTAFSTPTGPLPFTYYGDGIPTDVVGNKLPGAPEYKFSAGVQYAASIGNMTLTPRVDFIYTGKSYGNIFNGNVNEVPSFTQVNAQLQLDGPDKKWFARAWVQNLFDKDSITGLYLTDQSSGLYTNVFTLEPRRFGLTAGVKF